MFRNLSFKYSQLVGADQFLFKKHGEVVWKGAGLMVSALYSIVNGPGLSSGQRQFALCSWARHFNLTHSGDTFGTTEKDLYNGREEDRNLGTMIWYSQISGGLTEGKLKTFIIKKLAIFLLISKDHLSVKWSLSECFETVTGKWSLVRKRNQLQVNEHCIIFRLAKT